MATIVLCGSTRFREQFAEANHELSKLGHVVLTLADPSPAGGDLNPVDKIIFDLVYFEKIRMADVVFVIDDSGEIGARDGKPYIGFSTAREILSADMNEKPIISRSHAVGWGQVGDLLDERYGIRDSSVYRGMIAWARETLRLTNGLGQVKKLVGETAVHALEDVPDPINFTRQHNVMHAMLSIIACSTGTLATMAEVGLREVGLDPMDDVETALAGVVHIPDERTIAVNSRLAGVVNDETDSNLVKFARHELDLILAKTIEGGDELGIRMQEMMTKHVLHMVAEFSKEGHSGSSAPYAVATLEKLLMFQPLTPLTGAHDEWNQISLGDEPRWQNRRCSHVFMDADGRAYDSEGRIFRHEDGSCFTGCDSRVTITFPYTPSKEYVDVDSDGKPMPQAVAADRGATLVRTVLSVPADQLRAWRWTLSDAEQYLSTRGNRLAAQSLVGTVVKEMTSF